MYECYAMQILETNKKKNQRKIIKKKYSNELQGPC